MAACLSWVSHLRQVLCWPPISKPNVLTLRKSVCVHGCMPNILQQCQAFCVLTLENNTLYNYHDILKSGFNLQYIFLKRICERKLALFILTHTPSELKSIWKLWALSHPQDVNSDRWSIFPDFQRTLKLLIGRWRAPWRPPLASLRRC